MDKSLIKLYISQTTATNQNAQRSEIAGRVEINLITAKFLPRKLVKICITYCIFK
jgi:hypothetical protein